MCQKTFVSFVVENFRLNIILAKTKLHVHQAKNENALSLILITFIHFFLTGTQCFRRLPKTYRSTCYSES